MQSAVSYILQTLTDEINLLGGLGGELQRAKDELERMKDFLQAADLADEYNRNSTTWVHQIRDRAHDLEDILDVHRLNRADHHLYGVRLIKDHQIANRIPEIKERIRDISDIYSKYQNQFKGPEPGASLYKSSRNEEHGDVFLLQEDYVIGINKQKEGLKSKLVSHLAPRNVISIVGMGGLGKTTLVRKVYGGTDVTNRFTYRAWITVTKWAIMKELYKDAVKQLCPKEERKSDQELDSQRIHELQQIILRYLEDKQYFVVFDDVWEQTHWEAIHTAFPRNSRGSRIVITTRNLQLGRIASSTESGGSVTQLGHLPYDAARKLLCRKAFRGAAFCPPEFEQIFETFLKACQNLPLAIVVIGSILATKLTSGKWEEFYETLGTQLDKNSELQMLKKLLFHSYYALPSHLRTCLVYLSIFPVNAAIEKRKLLLLWIAEGFIEETDDMSFEEVAESYLNELIDRSLVQIGHISIDGRVESIHIHSIIQRLILLKASEQNSTTIFHPKVTSCFRNKARRLSIQSSMDDATAKEEAESSCKYLRSIILFLYHGGNIHEEALSYLLSKRLVKVLDIEGAPLQVIPNEIFRLLLLKYLCLRSTKVKDIPTSIGMLQNLETLDLVDTDVTKIPKDILKLRKLRHLLVYRCHLGSIQFHHIQSFSASCKIGKLKFLQNLYYIEADKLDAHTKIVNEIGKLVQLRGLGITKLRSEDGVELCFSLKKLVKLRHLLITSLKENEILDLHHHISPSDLRSLRTLELGGPLEKMPHWISSLQGITIISLRFSRLKDDPLVSLQHLHNLMSLELDLAYQGKELWFKTHTFSKLRSLSLFRMEKLKSVRVEKEAMPVLEGLTMAACKSMINIPRGIQHLGHLKWINFRDMSDKFLKGIENVNKSSVPFKRIMHVPRVVVDFWKDEKHHILRLNRDTGVFIK